MSEGSPIPPETPAAAMNSGEVCVPVKALAMPGEDEKLINPEVGDPVEFHVGGKVSRIEGENAYVSLQTVNGDPVTTEAAKTSDTPEPDEFAQLKAESASRMM